ncbi:hypothetical protein [Cryobacterium sp. HLT2-28]|nr:hypothetical protein [Cryobacterium sp. HLT2-28]
MIDRYEEILAHVAVTPADQAHDDVLRLKDQDCDVRERQQI